MIESSLSEVEYLEVCRAAIAPARPLERQERDGRPDPTPRGPHVSTALWSCLCTKGYLYSVQQVIAAGLRHENSDDTSLADESPHPFLYRVIITLLADRHCTTSYTVSLRDLLDKAGEHASFAEVHGARAGHQLGRADDLQLPQQETSGNKPLPTSQVNGKIFSGKRHMRYMDVLTSGIPFRGPSILITMALLPSMLLGLVASTSSGDIRGPPPTETVVGATLTN